MAKQAKVPQTEWTRSGMDISRTAVPYYQSNLGRIDEYLSDPTARQDMYLNKYFGADAVQNQDFLRQYNRAMGYATGNNYAATAGGLSSSAQRAYNEQQRYYNDLLARLQGQNVGTAYNMSNADYQNMLAANQAYQNAYNLGANYSQIEQQNALAKQANKNWLGQILDAAGQAGMSSGNPWGMAIGAAASTAGNMMQTDTSQAMSAIYGGSPTQYQQGNIYGNAFTNIAQADWSPVSNWWNSRGGQSQSLSDKLGYGGYTPTSTSSITPSGLRSGNLWGLNQSNKKNYFSFT